MMKRQNPDNFDMTTFVIMLIILALIVTQM